MPPRRRSRPLAFFSTSLAAAAAGSLLLGNVGCVGWGSCGVEEVVVASTDEVTPVGLSLDEAVDGFTGTFDVRVVWRAQVDWISTSGGAEDVGTPDPIPLESRTDAVTLDIVPADPPRLVEYVGAHSSGEDSRFERACEEKPDEIHYSVDVQLVESQGAFDTTYPRVFVAVLGPQDAQLGSVLPTADEVTRPITLPVLGGTLDPETAAHIRVWPEFSYVEDVGWTGKIKAGYCEGPDDMCPAATSAEAVVAEIIPV